MKELDRDGLPVTVQSVYDEAQVCHHVNVERAEIDDAITLVGGYEGDYTDTISPTYVRPSTDDGSFALGILPDGRYVVAREYEDYSGHGCQCGGYLSFYSSLGEALRMGLEKERRIFAMGVLGVHVGIS